MSIDWGCVAVIGVFAAATISYVFHDGSDPWVAAIIVSIFILVCK